MYHTCIPKVRPRRVSVVIDRCPTISYGGKKKGMWVIGLYASVVESVMSYVDDDPDIDKVVDASIVAKINVHAWAQSGGGT